MGYLAPDVRGILGQERSVKQVRGAHRYPYNNTFK